MARAALVVLAVLAVIAAASDEAGDAYGDAFKSVTCGSAVKLRHQGSKFLLHSHAIKWGSGSGQQSVTGYEGEGDPNSLWQVKEGMGSTVCAQGMPVKCGSLVRLQHVTTKRYLHSHLHQAPLSGRQEISAFGEGGSSDTGDNWRVDCVSGGDVWMREAPVRFTHIDTGKMLFTSKNDQFNQQNCRNCPIVGQLEISGHSASQSDANVQWATSDGLFFADRSAK